MGSLQHGFYDDECEGLTAEEINAFYGFSDSEEPQDSDSDEDSDRSDEEQGDQSGDNYEESEADMELDEGFEDVLDPDHFDTAVRLFMTSST